MNTISIKNIFLAYRGKITITFLAIILEAIFLLLIPFLIGKSIDGFINKDYLYIYFLIINLVLLTVIGTCRRLYDTRVYSNIYTELAVITTENEKEKKKSVSNISARIKLVQEFVHFIENELTEAFSSLIGIVGIFIILFFQDIKVFGLCLFTFVMTFVIYSLTENRIYKANKDYNDELEHQVDYLKREDRSFVPHFRKIAKNTVVLSDLESINYFFIQIFIIILIVGSLFTVLNSNYSVGTIFSILNYVIDFVMNIFVMPVLLGQLIRLKEITVRLEE